MNPVHSLHSISWESTVTSFSHLRLCFPSCLLPQGFSTSNLYGLHVTYVSPTCLTHPILLHLMTQALFCDEYRPWSFPNFLLFCFSWDQISFSALYSEKPQAYVSFIMSETKFHSHIKQEATLYFYVLSIYIFGHKTWRQIRYEDKVNKCI